MEQCKTKIDEQHSQVLNTHLSRLKIGTAAAFAASAISPFARTAS